AEASLELSQILPALGSMSQDLQLRFLRDFESDFKDAVTLFERLLHLFDWDGLEGQAHNLKGVIGYLSLPQLMSVLDRLEEAARSRNVDTCKRALAEFEPLMAACLTMVNAALSKHPASK